MRNVKKSTFNFCAVAVALSFMASTGAALAQSNDTLAKVKATGEITMGVRDSSGALSYTLGDGKYVGFHIDVCQKIVANVEKPSAKNSTPSTLPSPRKTEFPWCKTERWTSSVAPPPTTLRVKRTLPLHSPPMWKR